METIYRYHTNARWSRERSGVVRGQSISPELAFSAPPEFQGEAGRWTPEHLLVSAVVTCFITTFRAIAEMSKFEMEGLEVAAEGILEKGAEGFRFTRIVLRPVLRIFKDDKRERGLRLLEKAERACLISRSLRGEVVMEPSVEVLTTSHV